ncbi:hypothetical protein QAD02_024131 [Eretmocerus hayati]|uniref:Uncharacterized protein n=1 Tax=Eretmocerus hayati TaxID=131215 RepID=A0ACC2PZK1_9HYME|nr:hypothetical protein QAD02_024131 [Eretmocerus hayati]
MEADRPHDEEANNDMFRAIHTLNIEKLRLALDSDARPTHLNQDGYCPLHFALNQLPPPQFDECSWYRAPTPPRCKVDSSSKKNEAKILKRSQEENYDESENSDCDMSCVSDDSNGSIPDHNSNVDSDDYWEDDDSNYSRTSSSWEQAWSEAGRSLLYQVISYKNQHKNIFAADSTSKLLNLFFSYGVYWIYEKEKVKLNPFSLALRTADGEALRLFLEHGYQLDTSVAELREFQSWDPILKLDVFEILARSKVFDINTKDKEEHTAFYKLVLRDDICSIDGFKMMLDLGGNINSKDDYTCGSLMFLAVSNTKFRNNDYSGFIKFLVKNGGDLVENSGCRYEAPLVMVMHYGTWELLEWCIDHLIKSGKTMKDLEETDIFFESIGVGDGEMSEKLILKGFNINRVTSSRFGPGFAPLHGALWKVNSRYARLLLQWGANVDCVDRYGKSPLHDSCKLGNRAMEFTELVLLYDADINLVSPNDGLPFDIVMGPYVEPDLRDEIAKCLVKQIVIKESQDLPVDPRNKIYVERHFFSYYCQCQVELSATRASFCLDLFSYYDLLTNENLKYYFSNESGYDEILSNNLVDQFPIYGKRITDRLLRAREEHLFISKAKRVITLILGFDCNAFHLIYDKIISYLSHVDLLKLNKV